MISYKEQKRSHKLDDFDKEKLEYARKPLTIGKFIKIYNRLCKKCKAKAFKNPKREMKEYCYKCQLMMEKVYND